MLSTDNTEHGHLNVKRKATVHSMATVLVARAVTVTTQQKVKAAVQVNGAGTREGQRCGAGLPDRDGQRQTGMLDG